jgi:hypothetical protein
MTMAGIEIEALEREFAARQAEGLKGLRAKYGEAVEKAVGRARSSGEHTAIAVSDGAEAYAYPLSNSS